MLKRDKSHFPFTYICHLLFVLCILKNIFLFFVLLQLVLANDWLCFTDLLNSEILSTQNYSIMPYIPYITVTFHLLFATNQVPRIQYPHAEHDVSTRICLHKNCETLYIHYYVFTCNTRVSFNERFINFSILLYFKIHVLADL